jgi:hypothetical protein
MSLVYHMNCRMSWIRAGGAPAMVLLIFSLLTA